MATLLSLDKISSIGPSRSGAFQVERFQTDSYTIRAASGFNNSQVKYNVAWNCLTQAEVTALSEFFENTKGVSLIQWTPPLEAVELNFTVETYEVLLADSSGTAFTYNVSASLIKEYDLV